jgi:hypothetical protein
MALSACSLVVAPLLLWGIGRALEPGARPIAVKVLAPRRSTSLPAEMSRTRAGGTEVSFVLSADASAQGLALPAHVVPAGVRPGVFLGGSPTDVLFHKQQPSGARITFVVPQSVRDVPVTVQVGGSVTAAGVAGVLAGVLAAAVAWRWVRARGSWRSVLGVAAAGAIAGAVAIPAVDRTPWSWQSALALAVGAAALGYVGVGVDARACSLSGVVAGLIAGAAHPSAFPFAVFSWSAFGVAATGILRSLALPRDLDPRDAAAVALALAAATTTAAAAGFALLAVLGRVPPQPGALLAVDCPSVALRCRPTAWTTLPLGFLGGVLAAAVWAFHRTRPQREARRRGRRNWSSGRRLRVT